MTGRWHQTISLRDYDPDRDVADPHDGLSPTLVELIGQEAACANRVIEIGCGTGRLTRVLASLFGEVIALDRSEPALAEARLAAAREGWGNVSFRLADAERADYPALAAGPLPLVVAHLCMRAGSPMKKRVKRKDLPPSAWVPLGVSMDYSSVTYACSSAHEKMGHRPRNQASRAWLIPAD